MGVKILCSALVLLNSLFVNCQQQQCGDVHLNQTTIDLINETLTTFDLAAGTCTLYNGSLCADIIAPNVDYVYVSNAHLRGDLGLWTRFIEGLDLLSLVQSQSCKETMRQVLCDYYFPRCRNASGYQLLTSICKAGCLQIRNNLCPVDWANVRNFTRGTSNFNTYSVLTDCSATNLYLDDLPQCCVNLVEVPQATAVIETTSTILLPVATQPTLSTTTILLSVATPLTLSTGNPFPPSAGQSLTGPVAGAVAAVFVFMLLMLTLVFVSLLIIWRRGKRRESRVTLMTHSQRPREINGVKYDSKTQSMNIINDYSPESYLNPHRSTIVRVPSGYLRQLSGKMLIPGDCLNVLDCIGQGEFGIVYRAYLSNWSDITSPLLVAVKTVKGQTSDSQLVQMMEESLKMKDLSHPNILGLIGICIERGTAPYIVMPFMANGSLLSYLKQERNSLTIANGAEQDLIMDTQRVLLSICLQIAKGMEYLASQKFVHRDLATRNCMMDLNNVIKVADFGLSEDIYAKNYYRQSDTEECKVKLPIRWMALESLHDGVFSEKTDVWSYGITCWEVFTLGKIPYPGVTPFTLIKHLDEGGRLEKPSNAACSDEIYHVMQSCWNVSSDDRPLFSELVLTTTAMLETLVVYLDLGTAKYKHVLKALQPPSSYSEPIDAASAASPAPHVGNTNVNSLALPTIVVKDIDSVVSDTQLE